MKMIRVSILLIVLAGIVTFVVVKPPLSLGWIVAPPGEEERPLGPSEVNRADKSDKANTGLAALGSYTIVETETAPISTAVAAAARAAMEMPLPPAPEPEKVTNALLNNAQIASLRDRLRLTPDQAQY